MADFLHSDFGKRTSWNTSNFQVAEKGLGSPSTPTLGAFSPAQNRADLIVGLSCALISLIAALVTLRWFLLMRRNFRHHLILILIFSDAFKSLWYFIFPLVVFTRGVVISTSRFCQASGFFLSVGIESSDFAILMIALHAILQIFRPPRKTGKDGLYPHRHWIYLLWLILPLLAASLAFTNPSGAYVTYGTFCYLPKRPFWYRLALSWTPRYIIFTTIFWMYASIFIYVRIKFKRFSNLANSQFGLNYASDGAARKPSALDQKDYGKSLTTHESTSNKQLTSKSQSTELRLITPAAIDAPPKGGQHAPWDNLSFITSRPLEVADPHHSHEITSADFASDSGPSSSSAAIPTRSVSVQSGQDGLRENNRRGSEVPTIATNHTSDSMTAHNSHDKITSPEMGGTEQLNLTRTNIRRQLRFLFIYPAAYLIMWAFPFASHCLNYSDYYTAHPPFWLAIVTTSMLALQAGVDAFIFSWREKPWTRFDESSAFSVESILQLSKNLFVRRDEEPEVEMSRASVATSATADTMRSRLWWEEEGRKRKDSVWLGTDVMSPAGSRPVTRGLTIIEED